MDIEILVASIAAVFLLCSNTSAADANTVGDAGNNNHKVAPLTSARITPVGEARITPVGEARITPVGEARITPVGEARITPVGEARITPVGEARITPVGEARITPATVTSALPATSQTPVQHAKTNAPQNGVCAPVNSEKCIKARNQFYSNMNYLNNMMNQNGGMIGYNPNAH